MTVYTDLATEHKYIYIYIYMYTSNTSVTEDLLLVEVRMGAVPAWVGRDCPAEDTA